MKKNWIKREMLPWKLLLQSKTKKSGLYNGPAALPPVIFVIMPQCSSSIFCFSGGLLFPGGVMVTQRPLKALFMVRIHAREP